MREEYTKELTDLVDVVNNQWDEIVKHKDVFNKCESFLSRWRQRKADAKFKNAVVELKADNEAILSVINWDSDSDQFSQEIVRTVYALRIQRELTESILKGIGLFIPNPGESDA